VSIAKNKDFNNYGTCTYSEEFDNLQFH